MCKCVNILKLHTLCGAARESFSEGSIMNYVKLTKLYFNLAGLWLKKYLTNFIYENALDEKKTQKLINFPLILISCFIRRKFIGPYDYRFGGARMLDSNRHPVAQKKHQMYGKRFAHDANILPPPPPAMHHPHSSLVPAEAVPNVPMKFEPYDNFPVVDSAVASSSSQAAVASAKASTSSESEMKYSYTLDYHHRHMKNGSGISTHELVNHNHTYTMPPHGPQLLNNNGANPRPQTRDKKSKKTEEEHITRDEKRARALQIPISVSNVIKLLFLTIS